MTPAAAAAGVSHSPNKLRKAPDRTSMTMRELIYYNPSANPMRCVLERHVYVHHGYIEYVDTSCSLFSFCFGFFSSTVEEKKRKAQQTGTDSEQEKRCSRVLRELFACLINSLFFFFPFYLSLSLSLSLSSSHPSPPLPSQQ